MLLSILAGAHFSMLPLAGPGFDEPPHVVLDMRIIQLGEAREFPGASREGPGLTVVDSVVQRGGRPHRSGTLSIVQDFDADRAVWFDAQGNPSVMSERTFQGEVPIYTLRAERGAVKVNGAEYSIARDWSPAAGRGPDVTEFVTAAAPRATALSGQRVELRIASDVQWMEQNPDGTFSVKTGSERTEGLAISLTPRVEAHAVRCEDLSIEFREVARREPVKGVNLAIGRPVFRSSLVRGDVQWGVGEIVMVPLQPLTERSGMIFVLIRAEIAP